MENPKFSNPVPNINLGNLRHNIRFVSTEGVASDTKPENLKNKKLPPQFDLSVYRENPKSDVYITADGHIFYDWFKYTCSPITKRLMIKNGSSSWRDEKDVTNPRIKRTFDVLRAALLLKGYCRISGNDVLQQEHFVQTNIGMLFPPTPTYSGIQTWSELQKKYPIFTPCIDASKILANLEARKQVLQDNEELIHPCMVTAILHDLAQLPESEYSNTASVEIFETPTFLVFKIQHSPLLTLFETQHELIPNFVLIEKNESEQLQVALHECNGVTTGIHQRTEKAFERSEWMTSKMINGAFVEEHGVVRERLKTLIHKIDGVKSYTKLKEDDNIDTLHLQ